MNKHFFPADHVWTLYYSVLQWWWLCQHSLGEIPPGDKAYCNQIGCLNQSYTGLQYGPIILCLSVSQQHWQALHVIEIWMLRWSLRLTQCDHTACVWWQWRCIRLQLQESQSRWYGHVMCSKEFSGKNSYEPGHKSTTSWQTQDTVVGLYQEQKG